MRLSEKREKLLADFAIIEDPQDRLMYVLDFGKHAEPLAEEYKVERYYIEGCVSDLWLVPQYDEQRKTCTFRSDADAITTKGVAALVCDFYSGLTPEEIVADGGSAIRDINLEGLLTANRRNGLSGLLSRIISYSQKKSGPSMSSPL